MNKGGKLEWEKMKLRGDRRRRRVSNPNVLRQMSPERLHETQYKGWPLKQTYVIFLCLRLFCISKIDSTFAKKARKLTSMYFFFLERCLITS